MNIKEIIANKKELIRLKKAELKKCDGINYTGLELKGLSIQKNEDTEGELYRSIVGNTYGWMDSHDDVHIKGIFTKSINESGSRVLHLHDHVHQLSAKVGTTLGVHERELKWSDVGLDKSGTTTALVLDSRVEKFRNEAIFNDYKQGNIDQHSVGMQYVKIELAVNDPEEKEEFAAWNRYKDQVINIELAEDKGYFWAVTEAKLIEVSAVIRGSNILTPTLESKSVDDMVLELKSTYSENDLVLLSKALAEVKPETPLEEDKPQLKSNLLKLLK